MFQRPRITIIAAVARNRVIGCDKGLPWHLPEDLLHFQRATTGKAIIMGRKTWESLPGLLSHRRHIVLTRQPNYRIRGGLVARDLDEALALAAEQQPMVIGGAHVYALALPVADRMLLTEVDAEVEGDILFPPYDPQEWLETARERHCPDARHAYGYSFVTLERMTRGRAPPRIS